MRCSLIAAVAFEQSGPASRIVPRAVVVVIARLTRPLATSATVSMPT